MSKPTTKTLVPKLRFPEFRDAGEWSEKFLGDILNYLQPTKFLVKSAAYNDHYKIPVLTAGKTFILGYTDEAHGIFANKLPVIIFDDFTTATKFVDFPFKAKSSAMKILLAKKNSNIKFIYESMQMIKYEVGVHKRHWISIYSNLNIAVPKPSEQQKIADCLSSIDKLITVHSQKHEALKVHKKGLMQQLFPVQGDDCMDAGGRATQDAKAGTIPKLRFPEFQDAGEWKEKKLSKVAKLTSSKRVHLSDYVSDGIPFFRGKEISLLKNQEIPEDVLYISEEHYEEIRKKYGIPEVGDILITAVGTLGNVYLIQNYDKFYFKDGNLIWMKNISENSRFLETLLNVKRSDVLGSAIGSSQKALTMVELNKLEFMFPKSEEQQKIADCLSSIDELITAQAQKIESLKTHKKGLMQQLFPAADEVNG